MIAIACYADLHGMLPEAIDCDLAVIAGDICPEGRYLEQFRWIHGEFFPWLQKFPRAVWIAGNHDRVCDSETVIVSPYPHVYLQDNAHQPFRPMDTHNYSFGDFNGLTVWGSPWSLPYGNYAFMACEEFIQRKLEGVRSCSILVSHGPPYGYGDVPENDRIHCGSKALLNAIDTCKPRLVVCGHIHSGYGVYYRDKTILVNAACCNEEYNQVNKPILIETNGKEWKHRKS